MKKSWYSEKGTEERPSTVSPGMVDLFRCGKYIATVPAKPKEEK